MDIAVIRKLKVSSSKRDELVRIGRRAGHRSVLECSPTSLKTLRSSPSKFYPHQGGEGGGEKKISVGGGIVPGFWGLALKYVQVMDKARNGLEYQQLPLAIYSHQK